MRPPGSGSLPFAVRAPGAGRLRGAGWRRLGRIVDRTSRLERQLWVVALGVLVLDLATTAYGLELGLRESNPVALALLERYGYWGFVALKGFAVAVGAVGWWVVPRDYQYVVPLCLAGPWAAGGVVNALLIASVVGP